MEEVIFELRAPSRLLCESILDEPLNLAGDRRTFGIAHRPDIRRHCLKLAASDSTANFFQAVVVDFMLSMRRTGGGTILCNTCC